MSPTLLWFRRDLRLHDLPALSEVGDAEVLACYVLDPRLEVSSGPRRLQFLGDSLREIESPHVKEIRGKGLLIGVELKAESGPARPFCEKLMAEGMLCKETHESVIRFAPPLVIQKEDIDWALERVRKVLK